MEKENIYKVHKNIDFSPKVFGLFEKTSFIITMVITLILFRALDFFKVSSVLKIEIILIFLTPALLISSATIQYEKPIYTIKYLLKYLFSKKVYLFEREDMENKKEKLE